MLEQIIVSRWWVYQRERFPIFKNGLLIAIFSSSNVCYSALLSPQPRIPNIATIVVAFISTFFFFLQLRIADEFKDFEDDVRYRSYRPVPRGLIKLEELAILGVASAIIQLVITLWLSPALVILLGITWFYFGLMWQEFFVVEWLKANPAIYMLSHMVIVPLINLYGTGCDWLVVGNTIPNNLLWFLIASFFNGMVIEIGRKIKSPEDEEVGVDTYSAVWGIGKAVGVWLLALVLTAVAGVLAASQIHLEIFITGLLSVLFTIAALIAWQFTNKPIPKLAKQIDTFSGLWTLFLYLCLGIFPFLRPLIT